MSLEVLEFEPAGISGGSRGGVNVWCYNFYLWTGDFDIALYVKEGTDQGEAFLNSWEEAVAHAQLERGFCWRVWDQIFLYAGVPSLPTRGATRPGCTGSISGWVRRVESVSIDYRGDSKEHMSVRVLEFEPGGISVGDCGGVDVWCYKFFLWTGDWDIALYVEEGTLGEGFLSSWEEVVGLARLEKELLGAYETRYFYTLGYRTFRRGERPAPIIPEAYLDGCDGWKVSIGVIKKVVQSRKGHG